MSITLLLAAVIMVAFSDITDTGNRVGVSLIQNSFFGISETLVKKQAPSQEHGEDVGLQLKKVEAKPNPNLDKLCFESNYGKSDEKPLFQSEVLLAEEQTKQTIDDEIIRAKRLVLKDYDNISVIWEDGVFYTFNTTSRIVQKAFKMGMKVWSDNTCVDFIEDRSANDKLVVVISDLCSSLVGRVGGDQTLCLSEDYATEGLAVHEIGHALGLLHTMQRYDRDKFIIVIMSNVKPEFMDIFEKVDWEDAQVYGVYDYGSVMHYGQLSGSANNQPTMVAKDPHYQDTMGSEIIAFSDISTINRRYRCNTKCDMSTSAKCLNEGFPHPRNCSICICPSGYGGALCDRRPPGCGEDLVATNKAKTLSYRLGFGTDARDHFTFCHYLISAPEGRKIEVNVRSITDGYYFPGCRLGGVEIKAQQDQKMTGYRFCWKNGTDGPITSNTNPLPVILFNRVGSMQTILTYRYIDQAQKSQGLAIKKR